VDKNGNMKSQYFKLSQGISELNSLVVHDVKTSHFFSIIVLVCQAPLSFLMYRMGKRIKNTPELDSALNYELVQFNRLKAWRISFFTSIISLFMLALIT
jgi:hypothetical protein